MKSLPFKLTIFVVLVLSAAVAVDLIVGPGNTVKTPDKHQQGNENSIAEIHAAMVSRIPHPKILVVKHKRILIYYENPEEHKVFPIGLGFSPEGHKSREGDGRTPEGKYYICVKNPKSKYYLSLGISYPGIEDAKRGIENNQISQHQYGQIVDAVNAELCPLWNTPLGGEIFIHGEGSKRDWTLGCIALENKNMKYLFDKVKLKTPVLIVP